MQLGCPKCHERQTVAASLLASGEARVRCTACGTWFEVRVRGAVASPPPVPGEGAPAGRWYIRRRDETVIQFPTIRALYDYVVQGVVTIDDEISRGGRRWRPIRDVPELHGLFDAAEAAAVRVEAVPAAHLAPGSPPAVVAAQQVAVAAAPDDEPEPVLLADMVLEPEPAPPPAAPPAAPAMAAAPAPPVPERPRAPSESWGLRELDDLGGAADGEDHDEVGSRGGAWFWGLVVAVVLGGGAYAAWHAGLFGSSPGLRVSVGEALAPNEPAGVLAGAGGPGGPVASPPTDASEGGATLHPDAHSGADGAGDAGAAADAAADAGADVAPSQPEPPAAAAAAAAAAVVPDPPSAGTSAAAEAKAQPPRHEAPKEPSSTGERSTDPSGLGYDALMRQGNALLAANPGAAIAHFQRAMQLSPSAEPVAKIGWAYLNQGRPTEAIHWFEKALGRSKRYASTYEGLGRALERAGRRAEAIRYYEEYLQSFPVGSQAARVRANLERLRGAQ